jgi:hypothetical protein
MFAKKMLELENENSLLRSKLLGYQIHDSSKERLKLLLQQRNAALAEAKEKYRQDKANRSNDVTCDCGESDNEGYDEVDKGKN